MEDLKLAIMAQKYLQILDADGWVVTLSWKIAQKNRWRQRRDLND